MDECVGERLSVLGSDQPGRGDALWSVAVLTDGERLSASSVVLGEWLQQVARMRRQEGGQLVMESALPEIRCVAMLLAASRWRGEASDTCARLTDSADWLAARIQVLALSHVELALEQLPLLDLANQRLRRLSALTGHPLHGAQPLLCLNRAPRDAALIMRAWSREPMDGLMCHADDGRVPQTRILQQRSRARIAKLLACMRLPEK